MEYGPFAGDSPDISDADHGFDTGFIMSSASRCILTVATKGIGKGDFGRTREFNEYGREWCRDHGFLGFHDSGENDYSALKVEWQRILGMEPDDGE